MRSERQRFIDECLLRSFALTCNQPSGYLVARAAAFWEDREADRKAYEATHPPKLRKTQGQPAEGQRDRKVG